MLAVSCVAGCDTAGDEVPGLLTPDVTISSLSAVTLRRDHGELSDVCLVARSDTELVFLGKCRTGQAGFCKKKLCS